MSVFLPLAGCPLRVKGREHFSKGSTYIVVCNHNALVDVPVSTPFIPGGNKTIAKIEMARVPSLASCIAQAAYWSIVRMRTAEEKASLK